MYGYVVDILGLGMKETSPTDIHYIYVQLDPPADVGFDVMKENLS